MGQGRQERVPTSLAGAVAEGTGASLVPVDAEPERLHPGDPGTRRSVHTVHVPGDRFTAGTVRGRGDQALAGYLLRGPDRGALDDAEAARASGPARAEPEVLASPRRGGLTVPAL